MLKFLEHFAAITRRAGRPRAVGRDRRAVLRPAHDAVRGARCRSRSGRWWASSRRWRPWSSTEDDLRERAQRSASSFADFLDRRDLPHPDKLRELGVLRGEPGQQRLLLSLCGPDRLERLFAKLFDESEFLSPHGLRALSAYHREHPYMLDVEGVTASIDYEPAESTTAMFGGNSNWRGPIWFPLNYLMITVLERYHRFFGDDFTIEYPTGSGQQLTPGRDRRRPGRPADLHLHPRPRRTAALLRRDRAAADRPGLARQPDLQRVLPRRQRRRDRRLPPDRLDRGDRRPDPPPPRRGRRSVGDVVRRIVEREVTP